MEIKCPNCGKVLNQEEHDFGRLGEFCSEICKSQFVPPPTPIKQQLAPRGGFDIGGGTMIFLLLVLVFLIWSFIYCIYKKGIIGLLLWIFTTPIIAPLIVALLPDDNNNY